MAKIYFRIILNKIIKFVITDPVKIMRNLAQKIAFFKKFLELIGKFWVYYYYCNWSWYIIANWLIYHFYKLLRTVIFVDTALKLSRRMFRIEANVTVFCKSGNSKLHSLRGGKRGSPGKVYTKCQTKGWNILNTFPIIPNIIFFFSSFYIMLRYRLHGNILKAVYVKT